MQNRSSGGNTDPDNRRGCSATIIAAIISAVGAVLASGTFGDFLKGFSNNLKGNSKCSINDASIILKSEKSILNAGEITNLSISIADPKGLTFFPSWKSSLNAEIKPLGNPSLIAKYKARAYPAFPGRMNDRVTVNLQDEPDRNCLFVKEIDLTILNEDENSQPLEFPPKPINPTNPKTVLPPSVDQPTGSYVKEYKPTDSVKRYFASLKQAIDDYKFQDPEKADMNFELAYEMLSTEFKRSVSPSLRDFKRHWLRCGLWYDEEDIYLREQLDTEATISVLLEKPKCQRRKELLDIKLKQDRITNQWIIDEVKQRDR